MRYDTAVWIKQHYPAIKIFAVSTMDADTSIIKMIKSGAKGYVLKDAEPEELTLARTNGLPIQFAVAFLIIMFSIPCKLAIAFLFSQYAFAPRTRKRNGQDP